MWVFRHFPLNVQTNPNIGHDNSYKLEDDGGMTGMTMPKSGYNNRRFNHDTHPLHLTVLEASPHLELLFRPPGSFQPQVSQVTSVFVVAFVEISGLEISVVGQTHERRSLFCTWPGFPQDFHSLGSLQGILGGWECLRTSEISLAGVVWIMDGDTLIH